MNCDDSYGTAEAVPFQNLVSQNNPYVKACLLKAVSWEG
jgi:hypothetical protein